MQQTLAVQWHERATFLKVDAHVLTMTQHMESAQRSDLRTTGELVWTLPDKY